MPDITMCATADCPLKFNCHRNPASGTQPSEWRQSWSAFTWRATDKGLSTCQHYWPLEVRRIGLVTSRINREEAGDGG